MQASARQAGVFIATKDVQGVNPGDIYFLAGRAKYAMHTGIVMRVNGRNFEGLEGNVSNRISLTTRSLDTSRFEGVARLREGAARRPEPVGE